MPVERGLAKIGKKHRVEAKMVQNENTGLTGVYGKIWCFKKQRILDFLSKISIYIQRNIEHIAV